MHWFLWVVLRAPLLQVAWVFSHVVVLLWKGLDPNYIAIARWITDYVLVPLHPYGVWLVAQVFPTLTTFAGNLQPTHQDFDKILLGFLTPILVGILWLVGRLFAMLVRGHQRPPLVHWVPNRE